MNFQHISTAKLPTRWGAFLIHGFEEINTGKDHIALTFGDVTDKAKAPILRIHSECLTGDALFSLRCDCGPQLEAAMENISNEGRGILIYLRQEGRGIGLLNKIKAYELQDRGADTVEANEQLGFSADQRDYAICAYILKHLQVDAVRLMTNNPKKVSALKNMGIRVVSRLPHQAGSNPHNQEYLKTKKDKMGHILNSSCEDKPK